jgi:hypothetical protein
MDEPTVRPEPTPPIDERAVAIVHDYFTQEDGAERFVGELARRYPSATLYATVSTHGGSSISDRSQRRFAL